ncbi:hypothetical protein ASPZODRAFT_73964 [Penicilliopsis zonata CBS 506.65]|uniref:Carboxylic ester hydrolase n=1 Tax=Penicilliopsis zonata CBS 506.65 TaxID=1073090 RepID=A0A1L9S8Q9_9EURO|nr:hypothetical protein ASPZODRAFT_73964 [Penicilliopsis zonata CBS 506.65]OJJ43546.1 hypothetical protein ASPZODRAFT_73964 [Penicilliopsis zonata CBS 506.65]
MKNSVWASLAVFGAAASGSLLTPRSTILYENHGNWTAHGETPSAILFLDPASEAEARDICARNGEELLDASHLDEFSTPLRYQTYLGNLLPDQPLWPVSSSASRSSSSEPKRPFICTNTAPLVDAVETEFSLFPKVNVSSNGTTYMGVRDHMSYRFLGIPFALQPVGDLRLAYPIQWYTNETDYVLNATTYGPTCSTSGGYFAGNSYGLNPWGNSEACLLMNIFTPYLPGETPQSETLKPVLFWLHGGGGTATDATYDGASLTSRSDVILVSVNWRQGNFGALSFDDGYVDGNYGIADIVSGLQWVHDHIAQFGGDPERVTVFGQSAGGESVMDIVRCPKAAGLFSGAIIQSGALGPAVTQAEVVNVTVPAVAAVCGDAVGAERLGCLRNLTVDEFMNNISWSIGDGYANIDSGAIVDGIWIANQSVAAAQNGQLNRINYMAGGMPEEGESLLGTALLPNATDFNTTLYSLVGTDYYPLEWAELVEESGLWNNGSNEINPYNNTINVFTTVHLTCPGEQFIKAAFEADALQSYYYYNNLRAYALSYFDPYDLCTFPVGTEQPYYRCHSGDLYQVFGSYYIFDQPIRAPEDIGHTNLQQDLWGAFARTGDPNPEREYLRARGYHDALALRDEFFWEQYQGGEAANLDFPSPYMSALPWLDKCQVVEELYQLP